MKNTHHATFGFEALSDFGPFLCLLPSRSTYAWLCVSRTEEQFLLQAVRVSCSGLLDEGHDVCVCLLGC